MKRIKTVGKVQPKVPKKKSPVLLPKDLLRELQESLGGPDAVSLEELEAMIAQAQDPEALADDDLDMDEATSEVRFQAQELAFDAMDAPTAAKARQLAERALELDPDCVDALLVLAGTGAKSPEAEIALLTQAVSAGEQRLGPKFFERNKGHFWGLIETRAYMRARHQLAEALAKLERYGEAIGHFEALIALNPNDNQGVRYPLLGLYLTVEDLEGAGRLFSAYDEVQMTFFAWGRVIERFLAGELAAADEALKVAYSANRHVASLLIGNLPLPKRMPEMYQLGSKEEAAICLDMLEHALGEHPGILPWLLQRLPAPTISRAGRPGFRTPRQRGR